MTRTFFAAFAALLATTAAALLVIPTADAAQHRDMRRNHHWAYGSYQSQSYPRAKTTYFRHANCSSSHRHFADCVFGQSKR